MNLLKLSWKNLVHKPLHLTLNLILLALGTSLISFLLILSSQLEEKFEKNLADIDLVIGAKGSPLQLVLSSMYHVDAPTGNVPLEEVKPFLNPNHPLIQTAVPLSLGDSYQGFRIVGTNEKFLALYDASLERGKMWDKEMEVVLGASVASKLGLKVGSHFHSAHGFGSVNTIEHDEEDFKVTGILHSTGAVIDQLILCSTGSIWKVHQHSDEASGAEGHSITSILLKFKGNNYQALNLGRNINENTNLQAASPAWEINRLYANIGTGEEALRTIAFIIIVVSGLSIFISLFSSMKERKYELALMRIMGATGSKIFLLIILEGLVLSFFGFLLGMVFSHTGIAIMAGRLERAYHYEFEALVFHPAELILFAAVLLVGMLAALLPAIAARKSAISTTLSRQ